MSITLAIIVLQDLMEPAVEVFNRLYPAFEQHFATRRGAQPAGGLGPGKGKSGSDKHKGLVMSSAATMTAQDDPVHTPLRLQAGAGIQRGQRVERQREAPKTPRVATSPPPSLQSQPAGLPLTPRKNVAERAKAVSVASRNDALRKESLRAASAHPPTAVSLQVGRVSRRDESGCHEI